MKAHFEELNLGPALSDMQVLQGQSTQGIPLTDSSIAMEEFELAISQLKLHKELEWDGLMAAFLKIFDSHLHGSIP